MCVCVNVFAFLNEAFSSKTGWRSHLTKTFGDKSYREMGNAWFFYCLVYKAILQLLVLLAKLELIEGLV